MKVTSNPGCVLQLLTSATAAATPAATVFIYKYVYGMTYVYDMIR